jgi:hypothetical protein
MPVQQAVDCLKTLNSYFWVKFMSNKDFIIVMSTIENNVDDSNSFLKQFPSRPHHFGRRLSGAPILYADENDFPIKDAIQLAKFEELISKFPTPPTDFQSTSTSSAGSNSNQTNSSTSIHSNKSSWGSFSKWNFFGGSK